jgi:hypothetical protein
MQPAACGYAIYQWIRARRRGEYSPQFKSKLETILAAKHSGASKARNMSSSTRVCYNNKRLTLSCHSSCQVIQRETRALTHEVKSNHNTSNRLKGHKDIHPA